MAELRMPVWQFVRLMVQVEDTVAAGGRRPPAGAKELKDAWDTVWLELDQRLTDLGRDDPEAFANLMMDQEVVLTDATPRRRRAVTSEVKKVMTAMRKMLKETKDKQTREDLTFELEELEDLLYEVEE